MTSLSEDLNAQAYRHAQALTNLSTPREVWTELFRDVALLEEFCLRLSQDSDLDHFGRQLLLDSICVEVSGMSYAEYLNLIC